MMLHVPLSYLAQSFSDFFINKFERIRDDINSQNDTDPLDPLDVVPVPNLN